MLPDLLWGFSQGIWYSRLSPCMSFPIFKREIIHPYLMQCCFLIPQGKALRSKANSNWETEKYFQWNKNHQSLQRHCFSLKKYSSKNRGTLSVQNKTHQILLYLECPKAVLRSLVIGSLAEIFYLSCIFMSFCCKLEFLFAAEVLGYSLGITMKQVGFSLGVSSNP